jgi:hypothetical protein
MPGTENLGKNFVLIQAHTPNKAFGFSGITTRGALLTSPPAPPGEGSSGGVQLGSRPSSSASPFPFSVFFSEGAVVGAGPVACEVARGLLLSQ